MDNGTIYIYHHNDHDGIVAAGVLYNDFLSKGKAKKEDFVFIMIDYSFDLNFDHINFKDGDTVYFLDYSFTNKHNQEEFKKLLKRREGAFDVVWFDHHKSSIGLFEEYLIPGSRDTALCGAASIYFALNADKFNYAAVGSNNITTLADLFHSSPEVPEFLKLIDDYDCWKGLYKPTTNDFHYGLQVSHPTDDIIRDLLNGGDVYDIATVGKQVQKFLAFENKEYHVNMYGFEFTLPEEHGGYKCFCMNRKGNSLMFGDKVNEYDAVIPFYYKDGKWTYSMFTIKDNVDCEKTAKSYGGGGHLKAA